MKDTFREIKKSFGRFAAILGIVLIGVAFFSGVTASSYDMKYTADKYFDDNHVMDIRLLSTLGFDEEDIEAVKGVEGVETVMPGYTMEAVMTLSVNKQEVILYSYSPEDEINKLILTQGRMPENPNECVIRYEKMKGDSIQIGDKITLSSGTDLDISDSLSETEYEVVGFVATAYYLSYQLGSTSIGDGDLDWALYLPRENFTGDLYTVAYVTVKGAAEFNSYEDEYWDVIDPVTERLKAIGEERIENRLEEYEELNARYGGMLSLPTEGEWYVLDRNSHYAYVDYESTADQMAAIAKVFPVFFYLVAALVCLTTMTRMIDEQRGNIGTFKALGYSKISIAMKYIIYALFASVIGGVIGAAGGMYVFPYVIYNAWNIMYTMPELSFMPQPLLAVLSVAIAVLINIGATVWACFSELVETPALLMRPKAPKVGKKILLERVGFIWKHTSFTYKVTFRNLFRYKKRFLMTVIGISGCTALLIAGFGIKDSISQVVESQYEKIFRYDMTASFAGNSREELESAYERIISDARVQDAGMVYSEIGVVNDCEERNDATEKSVTIMAVSDEARFENFITLSQYKTKEILSVPQEGVLVSRKLAKDYGLDKGDDIFLLVEDRLVPVRIADVVEMYVNHYLFMSASYYEELFHKEAADNVIIANLEVSGEEEEREIGYYLINELKADSVTYYTGVKDRFDNMISALDIITVVLIISAGALAFVVLYNLINVNISERIREIATIKVLGFYDGEVASYVYRENIILTLIGGAVGLGLGVILHHFIMEVVELEDVMFGRNITFLSFLLSYAITLLFGLFVNLVMLKRLKNIPMIESLKSVE